MHVHRLQNQRENERASQPIPRLAGFEENGRATAFVSDLFVLQWLSDACGLVNMYY